MTQQLIRYLQGKKVYLRPLESSDAKELHYLVNINGQTRRMTGTQKPFTLSHMERYIEDISQDSSRVQFGIVLQENHQFIRGAHWLPLIAHMPR